MMDDGDIPVESAVEWAQYADEIQSYPTVHWMYTIYMFTTQPSKIDPDLGKIDGMSGSGCMVHTPLTHPII